MSAAQLSNEALAKRVETGAVAIGAKMRELQPLVAELWRRFDQLKPGGTISACKTRKEFCARILRRTPRAVRYMLEGGNFARGETISPGPSLVGAKPAAHQADTEDPRAFYQARDNLRFATDHLQEINREEISALVCDVEQLLTLAKEYLRHVDAA